MSNDTKDLAKSWTYQVIIDPSFENGDFGHAILQITSPSGERLAAGFYPSKSPDSTNLPDFTGVHHAVESPGHVRYENEEVAYPEYSFTSKLRKIDEDTAHKMIDYISEHIDKPGRYEVWHHNCVDFVEGAMVIAGDRLAIQVATTPFILKFQIQAQEAAEEILGKTKEIITDQFKGPDGVLNSDWIVVAHKYINGKEAIHETKAEPEVIAMALNKLTENYAKNIDGYGLHELVLKLKAHDAAIHETGAAIGGRGY